MAQVEAFAHRLCGYMRRPFRCRSRRHSSQLSFRRFVEGINQAAVIGRALQHQLFAVGLIGYNPAAIKGRIQSHRFFAVIIIRHDQATKFCRSQLHQIDRIAFYGPLMVRLFGVLYSPLD